VKKQWSFSRLLYNDKLMLIMSFLLATAIWIGVVTGPANIEDRQISVPVTIDMTNSYAYQRGLRIIGETEYDVKVTVSGKWSVISKLTAEDLRVRPDLNEISEPGDVELPLIVSRNSAETDYDILTVTPSSVMVACDYWKDNVSCPVTVDVSALTASGEGKMIGVPVMDGNPFPDNKAIVSGPESIMDQLDSLVVKVTQAEELAELKQYSVPLTAVDKNGNELDLSLCKIKGYEGETVSITVPIWEERRIELGYSVENCPQGISEDALVIEPSSLDVLGPAEELDALEKELADLGTVDFLRLSAQNNSVAFSLDIPQSVQAIDAPSTATVELVTEGLDQKTVDLTVTAENTFVKSPTDGLTVSVREQTLSDIVLVGNRESIAAITADSLGVEIHAQTNLSAGTKQYAARVVVKDYDDVWVYYGRDMDYVNVFVTLE